MVSIRKKLSNIKKIYKDKFSYIITVVSFLVMAIPLFYFTEYNLIVGNIGRLYANILVVSQIIISFLFGVNILLLWKKLKLAGSINFKEKGFTAVGSFIALLVSGCPACGITVASYLGLASFISVFPLFGLELKIAGIILLLLSINSLAKNVNTCKI